MDLETLSSLEDISSENVERVVNAFYSEPSNELNMWLTNAQFSKEAWAFCWDLLAPEKSELIKFFGVNSLFNKLQYHWHEVPDSELINLREKLFYILNNQQCPTKHIQKKICMTISQYLRKSILTRKEGSVEYLHQLLRNDYGELSKSQESNIVNFLEILTVLPGDVCYMDNTDPLKSVLAQEAHVVLKLGQNILEHQNAHTDSVVAASLCCLQVWLPLIEHLASGHYDHLYSQIFGTLQRNSKEALECLLVFFQCPTNHLYPFKVFEYMNRVTGIVDLWKQTHEVKDHDFAEDLCRLVVYVAQLCIKLLITHVFTHPYITKTTTDLMHMVVGCMDIPGQFPVDECHSDLTFAFWYFLQDALTGENDKKEVEEFFIPFFKAAFRVMKKKIIHPLHGYHLWSAEEKERFRCYRQDNADTVAYYQKFLGEEIVKDLCGEFMALLDSGFPTWQNLEAVLFLLASVLDDCYNFDITPLRVVYQNLQRIPCNEETLIYQIMAFITSSSGLIQDDKQMFMIAVYFLVQAMKQGVLLGMAAISLKDVFTYNKHMISFVAPDVIEGIKAPLLDPNTKVVDLSRLSNLVGRLLTATLDLSILDTTISPHIQSLLIAASSVSQGVGDERVVVAKLKIIASFLFVLKPDDDNEQDVIRRVFDMVNRVVESLLPVVEEVMNHCAGRYDVIEECIEVLRNMLFCLHQGMGVHLPLMCQAILHSLPPPHQPRLENTLLFYRNLLTTFRDCTYATELLQNTFISILNHLFGLLQTVTDGASKDLFKSTMTFLSYINKRFSFLLRHPSVDKNVIFDAAIQGLKSKNEEICKPASNLLTNLVQQMDETSMAARSSLLVKTLADGIEGQHMQFFAEVLFSLLRHHPTVLSTPLEPSSTFSIMTPEKWSNLIASIKTRGGGYERVLQTIVMFFYMSARTKQ